MASMKGIPLSKVSPAFLHANSTSHTWVFSAFAEIIDNAYDPDVSASELLIDKVDIRGTSCLIFLDNGAGMDADHLLKMLSFGFCEKDIYEKQGSHQPIGHYGNGFKSGSMRVGNDALVFTRCPKSASIGFLSQTYLKSTQADSVLVPLLEYRLPSLERIKSQESRNNLNAILEYSVFKAENELKEELKALEGSKTGTKIIIYNLKTLQDGTSELDFASDPTDIRCPEAHEVDATTVYHRPIQQNVSEYKRSLREYCSILFLRPRMKITIRGVRIKSKLISKSLSNTEIDMYKPTWLSRPVKIIFGFACDSQRPEDGDYGMMLYHRNRLIKAFEKVGYQRQPNDLGIGVVGVVQVDFLQPIHNKQDFNKDEKFNSVMAAFASKLNDYWNEKKGSNSSEQPVVRNLPDWLWAQCEHCLKWRRLPDEIDSNSLPEQWFCRMNPDATHNRCDIPEEPEDEDLAVKPTYEKTFKKKLEERKRLQQMEKEKEENWKRRKILEKEQELKDKEAALRAIQQVAAAQPLQDNRTVVSLQKALAEARRREEQQKRLILQIQEQKKAMEEQRNSLLQMAETLQAAEQMNSDDVFEQMSQFLSNIGPNFATSTPMPLSGKGRTEDSRPMPNGRSKRRVSLKTETGDLISVTENDIEMDVDVEFEESLPAKNLRKPPKASKPNIPAVKTDSVKKPPKPPANSPAVANNSRTPTTRNSRQFLTATASSESVAEAGAVTPSASLPAASKRKRQRKGPVMDVIDLTDEGECGQVVDVKPSLPEHGATTPGGEQTGAEEVKPEKRALDEVLTNGDVEVTPKQEICETATPNTTSAPPKDKPASANNDATASGATEEIHFRPSDDSELLGNPESFQDNLEAAIAAIQDRMEKEKCQQENDLIASDNKDDIIKDEIGGENINNNSDVVGRDKEIVSGQSEGGPGSSGSPEFPVAQETDGLQLNTDDCEQDMTGDMENTPPMLTFNDLLPMEDNDSTNHVGNAPAEDRRDYGNCYLIDDDDDDGGGESFNSCDAVDGDSADQEGVERPSYDTAGQEAGSQIVDPVVEPASESWGRELKATADADFFRGFIETENVTDCSPGSSSDSSNKAESHARKLNDEQQENLPPSRETLKGNTSPSNSDSSREDTLKEPEKNSKESHLVESFIAEDSVSAENALEQASPHSDHSTAVDDDVVSFEDLRDEMIREHLHTTNKLMCLEDTGPDSTHILRWSAKSGTSVPLEESACNIDSNDDAITNHIDDHVAETNVENKTILKNNEENQCTLKSVCDQLIQTDIDMAAVKSVFRQRDNSPVQIFNHKDVQSAERSASNKNSDKSSQVSDLRTNSEAQTDITLSQNSQKDPEILKSLQQDISLKTELVEKMEARLAETYANIHKLLGFIVPSAELGDISNIHQVVKDMVKYSEASPQQPLTGSIDVS